MVEGLFEIGVTQKHRERVSRKKKNVVRRRETCLDEVSGVNTVDVVIFPRKMAKLLSVYPSL